MLVLSRMTNETIELSNGVKITVVDIRKGRCRLGIDAPSEIQITRPDMKTVKAAGAEKVKSAKPKLAVA